MEDLRHNPQTDPDALDATIKHTPIQDNQQQAWRDKEAALQSLDDSPTRTMPQAVPLWEPDEPASAASPTPTPRRRIPTIALVCVVGVVSFVAGGMTVRLAAQMPLLFPQKTEQVEVPAAYMPATTEPEPSEEQLEDASPSPAPDPTDSFVIPDRNETDAEVDGQAEPSDDAPTYRWDFDSEGDRSLSYDTDDNRVTFDYDGYLFSLDLDQLMAEPDERNPYVYDDNTGYDTETERDVYGWTRQVWGGNWA